MKKIKLLVVMMICIFCITGCMRFNTTIEVKSNGKVDVSMLLAAKSEDGTEEDTSTSFEELEKEGWVCENYKEDNYYGVICKKKDLDLENLAEQMGATEEDTMIMDSNDFKITKNGFVYSFDWEYAGSDEDEGSEYAKSIKDEGGYMTFTLKVPVKAKSSNATTVSDGGRTLEWDLLALKPDEGIHAEFVLINWPLIIGIIIAVLIIIGVVIAIIVAANNKNNNIPMQPPMNQYGAMQPPMNQYGQQPMDQYGAMQPPMNQYGQQPMVQPEQPQYQQPPVQPQQPQYQQPTVQPQQPQYQQPVPPQNDDDTFQPYQ